MSADVLKSKKRKRSGNKPKKISFDEEVVPKDLAHSKIKEKSQNESDSTQESNKSKQPIGINKNKSRKSKVEKNVCPSLQTDHEMKKRKRKKKMENQEEKDTNEDPVDEDERSILNPTNLTIEKEESKRAMKRKKYQQLLTQEKMKVNLAIEEKALNYLSRWKHNRDDWKFEKLRQIWLQQNMFDSDKVPDKFWETLVEYFSNAKGIIRQTIIGDALKIIEKGDNENVKNGTDEDNSDNENQTDESENTSSKVQRAKSIIQSLEE